MLLTVDIGNTNVKFGIYDRETLVHKFLIPTKSIESANELWSVPAAFRISRAVICSVVPEINVAVSKEIKNTFNIVPTLVDYSFDFGLDIRYDPISATGTDRLVGAFSAAEKYGVPCIVCSFGTALTIDIVDENRTLKGGLIAPGLATMVKALKLSTSQLPEVSVEKPASVIQQTTIGSIQSGVVYGYFGLSSSLIERIKNETGDAKVIATGGFARLVAENINQIDLVDENLILDGLMRIGKRLQPA